MKVIGLVLSLLFATALVTGCAIVKVYTSDPTVQTVNTERYQIEIEAQQQAGKHFFDEFRLVLINKTDSDIKIDWSKSYYLLNGRKYGRLGWEGMTPDQLKDIKQAPLVVIKGGDTFSKIVFPLKLIGWEGVSPKTVQSDSRLKSGFHTGILPAGKNSIELALVQDGKTTRERLSLNIIVKEIKQ